jgi:hypothetical protein
VLSISRFVIAPDRRSSVDLGSCELFDIFCCAGWSCWGSVTSECIVLWYFIECWWFVCAAVEWSWCHLSELLLNLLLCAVALAYDFVAKEFDQRSRLVGVYPVFSPGLWFTEEGSWYDWLADWVAEKLFARTMVILNLVECLAVNDFLNVLAALRNLTSVDIWNYLAVTWNEIW